MKMRTTIIRRAQGRPAPADLWNQLANAVALTAKQDQIVWAIFGVFWAASAVLLVALFTTGKLPDWPVGFIVSVAGFVLSVVWLTIEYRALAWLKYYEAILRELEQQRLNVPLSVAFTGRPERVAGVGVRRLILACPLASTVLWTWATFWFWIHRV